MTFQWYWLLGCFVVGLLIGAVLVRKFGTDWLSMLACWLAKKKLPRLPESFGMLG